MGSIVSMSICTLSLRDDRESSPPDFPAVALAMADSYNVAAANSTTALGDKSMVTLVDGAFQAS